MGTLYVVSTPIGNLEDITIRAIKTLFTVDTIACEDTRRTGILLQELKKRYSSFINQYSSSEESASWRTTSREVIKEFSTHSAHSNNTASIKLIPFHDHNEQNKTPELIQILEQGKSIALVSDAGTPLINDPGFLLVRECRKRDIPIVSIPGPTALISALTVSGLPTDKFIFLGYPPEKVSHRKQLFNHLSTIEQCNNVTIIFYCAPHKLLQTLENMKEVFGDKEIVIVRELTKVHEEVWKGKLSDTLNHFMDPKGEFVILFNI